MQNSGSFCVEVQLSYNKNKKIQIYFAILPHNRNFAARKFNNDEQVT